MLTYTTENGTYQDVLKERDEIRNELTRVKAELDSIKATEAEVEDEAEDEAAVYPDNTFSDGVYLVGTDIPAGRYKGAPTGDVGYWKITSDPNGSDIIEIDNPRGAFYVQVTEGQYLDISRAKITLQE